MRLLSNSSFSTIVPRHGAASKNLMSPNNNSPNYAYQIGAAKKKLEIDDDYSVRWKPLSKTTVGSPMNLDTPTSNAKCRLPSKFVSRFTAK